MTYKKRRSLKSKNDLDNLKKYRTVRNKINREAILAKKR